MFSLNKIIWLVVILLVVWYVFKFIEKKNKNSQKNSDKDKFDKKNIDAFKCSVCGLWSTSTNQSCEKKNCPNNM